MKRSILALAAALFALALVSCSPGYVIRAAYEEAVILARRKPIDSLVDDPSVTEEERHKLALVLKARAYAEGLGLSPKDAFTRYSKVDRDVLVWVLAGSRTDRFEPYTWWFPFVGSVPYKGFFEREDAEAAAADIGAQGYETYMRPSDAFSTLGWFNDPVLSTTLRHHDVEIVNTVIHESLHSTLWIPGQVDFNETMANFVGAQGSLEFFRDALGRCATDDAACRTKAQAEYDFAVKTKQQEILLDSIIGTLWDALDTLYKSERSNEDKLALRQSIFEQNISEFRARFPDARILKTLNNAELIQLRLYLTHFEQFDRLFDAVGHSWPKLLDELKAIKKSVERDDSQKPYDLLEARLR